MGESPEVGGVQKFENTMRNNSLLFFNLLARCWLVAYNKVVTYRNDII